MRTHSYSTVASARTMARNLTALALLGVLGACSSAPVDTEATGAVKGGPGVGVRLYSCTGGNGTFLVSSQGDSAAPNSNTLREALAAANGAGCTNVTILFDPSADQGSGPGVYNIQPTLTDSTTVGPSAFRIAAGKNVIIQTITPGVNVTIDGSLAAQRFMYVEAGATLSVIGGVFNPAGPPWTTDTLTIQFFTAAGTNGGNAAGRGGAGGGGAGMGGAFYVAGSLTTYGSSILGNGAYGGTGGGAIADPNNHGGGGGGGIEGAGGNAALTPNPQTGGTGGLSVGGAGGGAGANGFAGAAPGGGGGGGGGGTTAALPGGNCGVGAVAGGLGAGGGGGGGRPVGGGRIGCVGGNATLGGGAGGCGQGVAACGSLPGTYGGTAQATGPGAGSGGGVGGGIFVAPSGSLLLRGGTINGNTAQGGAAYLGGGQGSACGGGVYGAAGSGLSFVWTDWGGGVGANGTNAQLDGSGAPVAPALNKGPAYCTDGVVNKIALASFTAKGAVEGVRLQWQTASEVDCGTLQLERCDGAGACVPAPIGDVITCKGSVAGADYEYTDKTAKVGGTYTYWLNEADIKGIRSVLGTTRLASYRPTSPEVSPVTSDDAAGRAPQAGGSACTVSTPGSAAGGFAGLLLGGLALVPVVRRRRK